jgi:phosphoribosylformylglycinamidine cyclo-ligase
LGSWEIPPLFRWLERAGAVPEEDMLRTFNMGLGLILAVAPDDTDAVVGALRAAGESGARVIGEIAPGSVQRVRYQS